MIRFVLLLLAVSAPEAAWAAIPHPGMALPWQLGLQAPVTPVMDRLYTLHSGLLVVITLITVFVLALLAYVCLRFSAGRNPTPSKTSHNTLVEIIWTAIPILILIGIAIPSLDIHYFMDRAQDPKMTLKVVGYQWYWSYEYPDQGGFSFESHIFPNEQDPNRPISLTDDAKLLKGEPRLLTVDHPALVPVDTVVRVLVTGADVIHSWSLPAFGIKVDAIPGRVNEVWFKATEPGTFRGQCSQLCGIWHGFMPIVVKVVPRAEFDAWAAAQKQEAAGTQASPATVQTGAKPPAAATAKPAPRKKAQGHTS